MLFTRACFSCHACFAAMPRDRDIAIMFTLHLLRQITLAAHAGASRFV